MLVSPLQYVLWIGPVVLQLLLLAVMLRRRLRQEFPIFFSYTIFQFIATVLRLILFHQSYTAYVYAYWASGAISVALGLAIIYEVFDHVFRPFMALRGMGSLIFRWAVLVLLLAAFVMAATGPAVRPSLIFSVILTLERSIRIMQCGLLFLLLLFATRLGLSWRNHTFGMTLGFGIFAAVELVVVTIVGVFGPQTNPGFLLARSASYVAAVSIWTIYMVLPEPARQPIHHLAQPDQWNFALATLGNEAPAPSLGMIESAVERVFQKKNGNGSATSAQAAH